ncbi:MAG: hypothetical protein BMS9Abin19_0980 [Gammaproteobacteria bacterium]|nr:MAG: hypothetical protein BMS9Abin19_0980 [Gammaproteobacteria bacterium]
MHLQRNILRPEATKLFEVLCRAPEMEGFTLIGGTALSLQLGHRISLDFDFARFGGTLPGQTLDQLITRLKKQDHQAQIITSPAEISQFKINRGMNLLDYARDYVIDGVKVTFFIHGKNSTQQAFYQSADKVKETDMYFDILEIDGLKTAKTLVFADRIRSRDLYDLYILIRDHHYTLHDLFATVRELGTIDDPEHYKAILRGEIPLDNDDEGLEAVDLYAGIEQIYEYFNHIIDEYETDLARDHFLKNKNPE